MEKTRGHNRLNFKNMARLTLATLFIAVGGTVLAKTDSKGSDVATIPSRTPTSSLVSPCQCPCPTPTQMSEKDIERLMQLEHVIPKYFRINITTGGRH